MFHPELTKLSEQEVKIQSQQDQFIQGSNWQTNLYWINQDTYLKIPEVINIITQAIQATKNIKIDL